MKETNFDYFNQAFLPTLKSLVDDYQQGRPDARDPEVLQLFSTMMKCMGVALSGFLN